MGREEERIAEIESLFRDVNEHIVETAERFDAGRANFYCECDDSSCYERVEVPLDDYEEVRGEGTHFIVRPDTRTSASSASSLGKGAMRSSRRSTAPWPPSWRGSTRAPTRRASSRASGSGP